MTIWDAHITQSNADGYQVNNNPPGTMDITSVVGYTGFSNQWNGFIFQDCPIPKDSVINAVTHTVFQHLAASFTVRVDIDCQLGNAALLTTTGGDLSSRTVTGSPASWVATLAGTDDKTTSSIAAQVQAVVNHASWAAGHNLGVIHRGQGVSHEFYYRMWDNNSNGTQVSTISIDYTPPSSMRGRRMRYVGSPSLRVYSG